MNLRRLGATFGTAGLILLATACSSDDATTSSDASTPGATASDATTAPGDSTPSEPSAAPDDTLDPAATDDSTDGETVTSPSTFDTLPPENTDDAIPPAQAALPADGPATVGGVELPAGRVLLAGDQRMAWITDEAVPGAAALWLELYAAREETGLYPVLLYDDDQPPMWEVEAFFPNQPELLDEFDLVDVLTTTAELNFDPPRTFEGLAPASSGPEDVAAADAAVTALPDVRIALVEAPRGADALSVMGWTGNASYDSTEALATGVRSWEDRYGARVVAVGPTSLRLALARPPATSAEAAALSEELRLLDPDLETNTAPIEVTALDDGLLGQHLWTMWWN